MKRASRDWALADAKARFSELVGLAENSGPQFITRRGRRAAVLVSSADYDALQGRPRRTIKDWLLAADGRDDRVPRPDRASARPRRLKAP